MKRSPPKSRSPRKILTAPSCSPVKCSRPRNRETPSRSATLTPFSATPPSSWNTRNWPSYSPTSPPTQVPCNRAATQMNSTPSSLRRFLPRFFFFLFLVMASVIPHSNAARAGIEPGMVVLTIDGAPVAERVAEIEKKRLPSSSERATRWFIYNRVFAGPLDTPVKIGLQRPNGSSFEVTITRQLHSAVPEVTTHVLPSGNVYIRFDGFQRPITKEFRQALQKFRDAPGLIVDLRRNGGAALAVVLPIAGYFFGKENFFAQASTRTGKPLSSYLR